MRLSRLLWWVYQLPIADLIRILLVCTMVFLWLHRQLDAYRWRCGLWTAVLTVWTAAVIWATILNRGGGTAGVFQTIPFHSYREIRETGNWEILRSSFMNVVLFYPAGLLLAAVLPKRWRVLITVAILGIFSLSIEIVQHALSLGRGEIDDVLHNTLGAACGCMALSLEPKLFPTKKKEQTSMSKILILTNHSYMLYRFRTELIQTLMKDHEVVLSMPFVGHEEDFMAMGLRCIETEVDRRGINPKRDLKLFRFYRSLLKAEKPDMVIT